MSSAERSFRPLVRLLLAGLAVAWAAIAPGCSGEGEVVGPSPEARAKSKDFMQKKFQDFDERKTR